MASKHGHGYVPNYQGADSGARFEFQRLADFAREVESSHAGLEKPAWSATVGIPVGAPVVYDFSQTTLTTGTRAVTSDDVNPDSATDRLTVRYGGIYFCFFSTSVEITFDAASTRLYKVDFLVNGAVPTGAPSYTYAQLGATATVYEQIHWTSILNVPDGGYIQVQRQGGHANDTDDVHSAFLYIFGFRL